METHPKLQNVTIENVDRAIRDWFDKTVNPTVDTPEGIRKVPVVFSQGERWAVGRNRQGFRDDNGVLILPVISVRRVSIVPDPSMTSLGIQTKSIQFAKQVDPKTSKLKNLGYKGNVYDVYTIPFPNGMIATYELVIQTQYVSQMNSILEKTWRALDIQKQFVAPLNNDGRIAPADLQYDPEFPLDYPYVVGFIDDIATDGSNFEEFTDQERIVRYTTPIKVPFVLQTEPDWTGPAVKVERTAYKVVMKMEEAHFVDDPEELDRIFSPPKR